MHAARLHFISASIGNVSVEDGGESSAMTSVCRRFTFESGNRDTVNLVSKFLPLIPLPANYPVTP